MIGTNFARALLAASTVSILASCGGARYSPVAGEAREGSKMTSGQFHGEVFSGKSVSRCHRESYHFFVVSFALNGTATGPFPGTVVARGTWTSNLYEPYGLFEFRERFSLTSGSRHYLGKIDGRGNAGHQVNCRLLNRSMSYSLSRRGWQGNVLVNIAKHQSFSESFY